MPERKPKPSALGDFYFEGFGVPESNYFKMPKEWTDLTAKITSLAELKMVEYVLKHTWGYQEYGITKRITTDEFMNGRKRKSGPRMDHGTGLSNRSVIDGLRRAVTHGLLVEEVDDTDKARVKKSYALRMRPHNNPADDLDVKNLHTGVKKVHSSGEESSHRSEKDTLERNSVVVNTLTKWKIDAETAEQLLGRFSPEYIQQKVEFLDWKLETATRGRPIEDPAAWLVRAIERDYKPPSAFHSRQEIAREQDERDKRRDELRAEHERERARHLDEFRLKYGTSQRELDLWPEVLQEISRQTTTATFNTWFTGTSLLALETDRAVIGVPNNQAREWLQNRLYKIIRRSLDTFLDSPVELEFVILQRPA